MNKVRLNLNYKTKVVKRVYTLVKSVIKSKVLYFL